MHPLIWATTLPTPACRCTPPKKLQWPAHRPARHGPGSAPARAAKYRLRPLVHGQSALDNPSDAIWRRYPPHAAVDWCCASKRGDGPLPTEDQKFGYEQRALQNHSHRIRANAGPTYGKLNGQVERQDALCRRAHWFWLTCWVDGDSPDLSKMTRTPSENEQQRLEREAKEPPSPHHSPPRPRRISWGAVSAMPF
jgi:hypothetical protein